MENGGTIIEVKAGESLPNKFLDLVLKEHTTEFGYAAQSGGKVELYHDDIAGMDVRECLYDSKTGKSGICDVYADDTIIFQFRSSKDALDEADHQPFPVITDADDNTLLAVMLEGDFSMCAPEAPDGKSNEYHALHDFIAPQILEIYENNKNGLAQTVEHLRGAAFRKVMEDILEPRGVITILGGVGEPVTIARNELGKKYKWGYTSRTLGYEEGASTKPKTNQELIKERIAAAKAAATGEVPEKPVTVPENNPPKVEEDKPMTVVPPNAGEAVHFPPAGCEGKQRRKWYETHLGYLPPKFEQCPGIPTHKLHAKSSLRTVVTLKDIGPKLEEKKEEEKKQNNGVTERSIPVVGPGELKNIMQFIKDGKMVKYTKEVLQEKESEHPFFSDRMGEPIEDIIQWSFHTYDTKLSHHALACLCHELRFRLIEANPSLLKNFKSSADKSTEEETDPVVETPKPEEKKELTREEKIKAIKDRAAALKKATAA